MESMDRFFSFARAHARALESGCGPDEALGQGLAADYASRIPAIDPSHVLAGMPGSDSIVQLGLGGLACGEIPEALTGTDREAEAKAIIEHWRSRTTGAVFEDALNQEFSKEELSATWEPSFGWGGGWGGHAVLGYERVLSEGIAGIRKQVETYLQKAEEDGAAPETLDWYRAELHVCDGITAFITNHGAFARGLADASKDPAEKKALEEMAEVCEHICTNGARDLNEAVQLMWFVHVLDEKDSPGRIDQFLLPYYMAGGDTPEARREAAWPVLDDLWDRFIACRSWNVCLAGQTAQGEDASNELTWLFLDLQEKHNLEAPNLSVRFFKGSPPGLMRRCIEVISKGSGQPAIYNDELMIPALCGLGIPIEHARNYAMNGCAQVDIQGMSHMGLEDGELSLAKCLEYALHAGRSAMTDKQAGCASLPAAEISDFDTLMVELNKQIEYGTDLLTRKANVFQKTMGAVSPHLFRSLFIEPCLERGLDMKRGGPLYNHGQFQTEGIANCGDALYAIKRLVFDEKRMALPELVEILDNDWDGQEQLRLEVRNRFAKFGNDDESVDVLTAGPLEHYFRHLNTIPTWRGGRYSGGVVVFNRAIGYGKDLAASADGRVKGEPVADSLGPAQGRDLNGPTAMLRSAARLPLGLATCATCLNLKLTPSIFKDEGGFDKVATLFQTYFKLGGQQLQVNVVDRETLVAAQKNPEDYGSLVVRVGGYSARFTDLAPEQQDDIIARTAHV